MAYNKALVWRDEGKLFIKIEYANGKKEQGQLPLDIKREDLLQLCKKKKIEPQHVQVLE